MIIFILIVICLFLMCVSYVYKRIIWNRKLRDYNGLQKIYEDLKQENISIEKISYIYFKNGRKKETLEFVYVRLDEERLFVMKSVFHYSFKVKYILNAGIDEGFINHKLINHRLFLSDGEFDFFTNTLYLKYK